MAARPPSRWEPRLALLALLIGLAAATSPAWRVLMLGRAPTLDELLQIVCERPADGRRAWPGT